MSKQRRIVVTGGPGGGKTTALDLFQREFHNEVATVPEAATILFSGGVKRDSNPNVVCSTQKAICQLQKNLEDIISAQNESKTLICDRGTLDGLAYWQGSEESFFHTLESDFETELNRYDAVIFFETGASSSGDITSNNPIRNESSEEAIKLDQKLQEVWSKHPHFVLIKSSSSFLEKIRNGVTELIKLLEIR